MITVKFYLDSRATKENSPSILKIAIIYKLKTVYFPTGIKVFPKNWDNCEQYHKMIRHLYEKDTN